MANKETPKDQSSPVGLARLNLRIPATLHRNIKRVALEQNVSMTAWMTRAFRDKLARDMKEQGPKTHPEENRFAPKTQAEWTWAYAFMRFLRSKHWKQSVEGILADIWKLRP